VASPSGPIVYWEYFLKLKIVIFLHLVVQISMYEDKMTRLKQEQKRLQQLNSENEDEVKTVLHLCDELLIKDMSHFTLDLILSLLISTSSGCNS